MPVSFYVRRAVLFNLAPQKRGEGTEGDHSRSSVMKTFCAICQRPSIFSSDS